MSSLLSVYSKLDTRLTAIGTTLHYIINVRLVMYDVYLCIIELLYFQVLKCNQQINGHYPSVVFDLLIIHYLQQTTPPVLPVIHELLDIDLTEREEGGAFLNNDELKEVLVSAAKEWSSANTRTTGQLMYGLLRWV